nr:hypothetical protein [Tanacetum cinerariifolium]
PAAEVGGGRQCARRVGGRRGPANGRPGRVIGRRFPLVVVGAGAAARAGRAGERGGRGARANGLVGPDGAGRYGGQNSQSESRGGGRA